MQEDMGDGLPFPRGPGVKPQAHSIQACNKFSDHDCSFFGLQVCQWVPPAQPWLPSLTPLMSLELTEICLKSSW